MGSDSNKDKSEDSGKEEISAKLEKVGRDSNEDKLEDSGKEEVSAK